MLPHGQQCQVEGDVANARVAAKDGVECDEQRGHEERLPAELEGQRDQVEHQRVQLERVQEEDAEVVEHFGEKVPEQANVRLQVTVAQAAIKEEDVDSLQHSLGHGMSSTHINPKVASTKLHFC